jgi:replication factor A1
VANQRYSSLKNDFCLVFDKNADIVEVPNDSSILQKGYTFVGLDEITTMDRVRIIDFIGIVASVGPMSDIQLRSGEMKSKRAVILCDESGLSIECQIWAEVALKFDDMPEQNPVIAIKGARVVQFQGQQLTMDQDASFDFNPAQERTKQLKEWFKTCEKHSLKAISTKSNESQADNKLQNGRLLCEM